MQLTAPSRSFVPQAVPACGGVRVAGVRRPPLAAERLPLLLPLAELQHAAAYADQVARLQGRRPVDRLVVEEGLALLRGVLQQVAVVLQPDRRVQLADGVV